ncbi:hypothetical protein ACMG5N_03030 [Escherichia coli]|uniref:hypothetical protein n=1 Tax=Escherichia coli TaxID=562 RepID=UPI0039BF04CF
MECKVSDLVKRGHDQAAELKASCGAVDVRDVAQLISDLATQLDVQLARSNALAAENAGLKDEISNITFMRDDDFFGSTQRAQEVMGRLVNVKTPATDAFLAEVRAQGVDECVRQLVTSDDDDFSDAPNVCAEVARQFRKGVQS